MVGAALVAGGAAVLGTLGSVRRAMRLAPAEAMRPEPPARFRPTIVEKLGLERFFSHAARMILRELERRPLRTFLSGLGLALAAAILVLGTFMLDAIEEAIEIQFYGAERSDVTLTFVEPASAGALYEVQRLPAVLEAEPFRSVPARIRFGHVSKRVGVLGLPEGGRLHRVLDERRGPLRLPPEGLVVSEFLANALGTEIGDVLTVEVLEGARPFRRVTLTDVVADFSGTSAYMRLDALHRMMREEGALSGAFLRIDESRIGELHAKARDMPRVAAVNVKRATVESFRKMIAENLLIMRAFNVAFATIIAFGVVYNTARISLAERSLELGTLRVMGFTHAEISAILLGELAVLVLVAIPVGLVLGHVLARLLTILMQTETQRFPFVISRFTYGFAATVVLVAALVSGSSVRRQLRRLDLVGVLKARD